ncbi:MAG TPA: carboxylesterase [Bacteroidetes bacterium]|nr:carboxylesterase [Bacteroidota bacterium]
METDFKYKFINSKNPKENFTLLLLHGTGGDEDDLIPIGKLFGENVNLLGVRGRVLEHGMPRYFRRLAEGVFDVEDLKYRTKELYGFLNNLPSEIPVDKNKLVALGYSNGANIAGSLLLTYPDFFKGVIQFRPMKPFSLEQNISINNIPVFISSGKMDFTVTEEDSKKWADELKNYGADVNFNLLNSGHNLTNDDVRLAVEWFKNKFN